MSDESKLLTDDNGPNDILDLEESNQGGPSQSVDTEASVIENESSDNGIFPLSPVTGMLLVALVPATILIISIIGGVWLSISVGSNIIFGAVGGILFTIGILLLTRAIVNYL